MSAAVFQYILSLAGAALFTGAILSIARKGPAAAVVRMAAAMALILVILRPMVGFSEKILAYVESQHRQNEAAVYQAKDEVTRLTDHLVSKKLAEYVEGRAAEQEIRVKINIEAYANAENEFFVGAARASYSDEESYRKRAQVEEILKEECGIPADIQEHRYE